MDKNQFFKRIFKKNKEVVLYYIYTTIYLFLLIGTFIVNKICLKKNFISLDFFVGISIAVIVLAIIGVVIDLKHMRYINSLFKSYQENGKIPKYNYSNKLLKIIVFSFFIFLVLLLGFVFSSYDSSKIKPIKIDGSHLTMVTSSGNIIETEYMDYGPFAVKIPKDFELMSEENLKIKYPLENRPKLVYTNDDFSINVAYSVQENSLSNDDISATIDSMNELYGKLFTVLESGVFVIEGRNIGYMKFITPAIDSNIYNHFLVMSIDGKLTLISFNCIEKYREEWEKVGDFILDSIVFE